MRNRTTANARMVSARLVSARTLLTLSPALLAYCFGATLLPAQQVPAILSSLHTTVLTSTLGNWGIPSNTTIGTWDADNRVFTLTTDVCTIEIDESNLTLDGAGHHAALVYAAGPSNLTIRNMILEGGDNLGDYRHIELTVYGDQPPGSIVIENNVLWGQGVRGGIRVSSHGGVRVDTTVANNVVLGNGIADYYNGFFQIAPAVGEHSVTGNTITNLGSTYLAFAITVYSGPSIVADNYISGSAGIGLGWGVYECTRNIISGAEYGLVMIDLEDSCVTDNTLSLNTYGIWIDGGQGNRIYNNNFIDNATQVYVSEPCTTCAFNLAEPVGGNYWSDWTSPDSDGDGFVDFPYVFDGGQDDLPWAVQDGWLPQTMIEQLVSRVLALNLQQGIENSLDAKLDAAQQALDDVNANNDDAAINTLGAFINAVEAQRGNKISETDADALIAAVQHIIDLLNAS